MKILMTILSVMLVIVIVFSTFGIALRDSSGQLNFFTAFGRVEKAIGDFSQTTMKIYNSVKGFISDISPSLTRLFMTIKNLFATLDEKLGIFDKISNLFEFYKNTLRRIFMSWDIIINYFSERGIKLFDDAWWHGFSFALSCYDNDSYYVSDAEFNYDKLFKVIDAYYYGLQNEYSYLAVIDKFDNIMQSDSFKEKYLTNTYYFYSGIGSVINKPTFENSKFWFQSLSLKIPDDFMPAFDAKMRAISYFNGCVIPVGDNNFVYEKNGYEYTLTGFSLVSAEDISDKILQASSLYSRHLLYFVNDTRFHVYFEFSYVEPETGRHIDSTLVDAIDYFSSYDDAVFKCDTMKSQDYLSTRDDSVYN